ncbi:MAG: hypothetical protein ACOCUS_05415 [Polyangiales bacterium]
MTLIALKGDRTAEGSIGNLERDERGNLVGEPLDAISVQLHEPAGPNAVWHIRAWANTGYGFALVGQVLVLEPDNATTRDRVVMIAGCPGARAWTLVARRLFGPTAAQATLRAAVSRYSGVAGIVALGRAVEIGREAGTYDHDAGTGPATTTVPETTTPTHMSAEAGPGGATVTIGSFPTITIGPGQVFSLPAGALDKLRGPVDFMFAGDIVNRFVSWGP